MCVSYINKWKLIRLTHMGKKLYFIFDKLIEKELYFVSDELI
jgi:hypothetical protein